MKQLLVSRRAEQDIEQITNYYEEKANKGQAFVHAIRAAKEAIASFPDGFQRIDETYRRYVVTEFPYIIVYRNTPRFVAVIAVYPQHGEPGAWRRR